MAYIASVLEREGHKVKILDLNAFKKSDKDVLREVKSSDMVGIGGLITEYTKIVNLTNYIKENQPDMPIMLGGPCTTTLFDKVLERTKADYGVIGEGEVSTVNLVKAIEKGSSLKDVKGIVFRENGKTVMTNPQPHMENLDELPFPSRHLLDMEKYIYDYLKTLGLSFDDYKKVRNTTIISSRGCPYHCSFCDKGIWGYKWRARSPQNLIDEIAFLKEKYKINCIWFTDDTFVVNQKRVEEFSKRMEEMDVIWNCYGRVNLQGHRLRVRVRRPVHA